MRHSGPSGRPESAPTGDAGERQQLIQVATRCTTVDEFVEKFAAFAWESSLVLPAASALPIGTQGRFVILLRDQSVAMRGRCRVTEAKQQPVSARNPTLKKVMMRVALLEMDEPSRALHKRLIALRSAPVPLPIPTEPSETTQIEPARQGSAPIAAAPAPAPVAAPVPVAAQPAPAPAPGVPAAPVKPAPPSPRVSLQKTMIGIGIGPDGKAFLAQPAAPRSPTPPRVETRVPGAPDTLPANPLSELSADDVDSFIEFKLLESDRDLAASAARAASDVPITAEGPAVAPRRDTAAIRLERLTTALSPGLRRLIAKVPPPTQRRIVRAAPYVGIALVGLVIGFAVRGKPAAPPRGATATAAAPAVGPAARAVEPELPPAEAKAETPPVPAPKLAAPEKQAAPQKVAAAETPVPRKAEKPAAAEPAASPEKPVLAAWAAGPPACVANVTTQPKDVKVIWGGKLIGSTPIDGARVPCGPASVSLERERWQVVTVDVNAELGAAASVHERLSRPRGTIAFTSSPPGAQLVINRVAAGTAPKQVDVQRYEKLQIKATLKGYAPWTKSVYLKDPESAIDIQLSARK